MAHSGKLDTNGSFPRNFHNSQGKKTFVNNFWIPESKWNQVHWSLSKCLKSSVMDFQNRVGSKTGGGGQASYSESNRDRRERLAALAAETIDLQKDPYFMRNHLGTYECKLCLTLHNNEASYLAHTQGKKHQSNLARRAAKEAKDTPIQPAPEKARVDLKKFVKIGRPGYRVTKQREPEAGQQSLLFEIDYPEIADGVMPRHRFMSAYEQKIEPPGKTSISNWHFNQIVCPEVLYKWFFAEIGPATARNCDNGDVSYCGRQ